LIVTALAAGTAALGGFGPAPAPQPADDPTPSQAADVKPKPPPVICPVTVTGTATGPGGAPVNGATVYLMSVMGAASKLCATMTTDAQGRYAFRAVAVPVDDPTKVRETLRLQVSGTAPGLGLTWHGRPYAEAH